MTDDTTLRLELVSLLTHNLNVDVSSVHEDLIGTGLLDSLKIVELLMQLEQRYALSIPLEDLEIDCFRSVASIADLIARLCASAAVVDTAAAAPAGTMRVPLAD